MTTKRLMCLLCKTTVELEPSTELLRMVGMATDMMGPHICVDGHTAHNAPFTIMGAE